jgi:O-antigen/teichoic acid export membrane protein
VIAKEMSSQLNRLVLSLRNDRVMGVIKGAVSGVFVKGTAFFITMLTVPILLEHLGVERYGVWVAMLSIIAWISLVDLGLANGLTPLLTKELAKNDVLAARECVSSAFWGLFILSAVLCSMVVIVWRYNEWAEAINIDHSELIREGSEAIVVAVIIFLLQLPLSITQRIYLAAQQGFTANVWQFIISLSGLAGILMARNFEPNLILLVVLYSGAQLLVNVINAIWLFFVRYPELRPSIRQRLNKIKNVTNIGGYFLLNQLATLLVFQKDSLMIAHYYGAEQVARFSVVWQMFLYLNVINMLIAPYLGPAFGEAYTKNEKSWVRYIAHRYLLFSFFVTLPMVLLLAFFSDSLVGIWVGEKMLSDKDTVLSIAALTTLLSVLWPMISMLNGTGEIKTFTVWYAVSAVISTLLSTCLIGVFGPSGSVMSTVLIMLPFTVFIGYPQLRRLFA